MVDEAVRRFLSRIGKKGGAVRSEAKKAAARERAKQMWKGHRNKTDRKGDSK